MNGELPSIEGGWEFWTGDRAEHDLALRDPSALRSPQQDPLEMSDADLEVLGEIWSRFGHMNGWQLRAYTLDHCPEWKDPEGSMVPMQPEDLFQALQFAPEQCEAALGKLRAEGVINAVFASAGH